MVGSTFSARVYLAPLPQASKTVFVLAVGLCPSDVLAVAGARHNASELQRVSVHVFAV